jgi:uncharacterized protein YbcC (UPF0753/DUF2309 family)
MNSSDILVDKHMDSTNSTATSFDEHKVLHDLKHYLPAQAPLKDFIHHNTLHAFQKHKFYDGLRMASDIFGYRVSLSLKEYRELYESKKIHKEILERIILETKGVALADEWMKKVLYQNYKNPSSPRIGTLRSHWKRDYRIDLDALVHPILFRILCSYLDQGISIWGFPIRNEGFLKAIREMERNSFSSIFKKKRARKLLLETNCEIADLLKIIAGKDQSLYEHYIFDQQFAHQGWSGMVSTVEDMPQTLLDTRQITIRDLIALELLLEIDALDASYGDAWQPLGYTLTEKPVDLFSDIQEREVQQVWYIWQQAFEWSYYDGVLAGLKTPRKQQSVQTIKSFQAMFCIDDRECSFRRYLEKIDPACETFGTPGFFSVEFFFQPENGKFYNKLCPAPVTPKYLIKEEGTQKKMEIDVHFSKHSHSFFGGWLISQTLGFWSAFKLFLNIFRPTMSPATASSFKHMDKSSRLTIENTNPDHKENNLQIGFTVEEMANRVEALLKSIGLVKDFASVIYTLGHGSSSVNNPHFAAYDCGACSGRAGSVNSRVVCHMANHPAVRKILKERGIDIPATTQFVGGLHDTTRDEVVFFDENSLSKENLANHEKNLRIFKDALDLNSKERSRRFDSINSKLDPAKIHDKLLLRSVSLFEPRPELNHATNTLCIVGRRSLTKGLFLDRRSFLNSYDYTIDPEGKILMNIMRPLGPVCGGINLEYFFSRVDNQKLGAGTKLPHNVMGLFGVANGIDGDLRPGLPSQMIEMHDPIRLMIIVEHFPEVVLQVIKKEAPTYEWFINDWVNVVAVNPETQELSYFKNGEFVKYEPMTQVEVAENLSALFESSNENLPVYQLS